MFLTIIVFFLILSVLVFVHEFGHFWVARKCGLVPEEFGFGYPPRICGWQKLKSEKIEKVSETEDIEVEIKESLINENIEVVEKVITDKIKEVDRLVPEEKWRFIRGKQRPEQIAGVQTDTIYSLNWVPIGGFVKLGEDDDPGNNPNHFNNKPIWQRAIILAAGVLMNFVLAVVLIAIGFMVGLPQTIDDSDAGVQISNRQIQIVEVMADSPAAKAGLEIGDAIISINSQQMQSLDAMEKFVDENKGKKLDYKIKRLDSEINKEIIPEVRPETNKGGIGIAIVETGIVKYPFFLAIWEGIKTSVLLVWVILVAFAGVLKGLFTGAGVGALAGPVGIAVLTGQVTRMGFIYIMQFTAILSINLAIINALPFPALDGGRLLFLAIEKIKGKSVKKEIEGTIHYIGFALLMVFVALVTYHDIAKYTGNFKLFFNNILNWWQK